MASTVVTLLSDFGLCDAYVGIMKGVILSICPEACCVDLTHDIPPHDIIAGALVLRSAVNFFPSRTVHLAVVDPGVGSTRAAIAIETDKGTFVGPDNGLLSLAVGACGGARAIWAIQPAESVSHTFHGRDVFAPAAARFAYGRKPPELATPLKTFQQLTLATPQRQGTCIVGEILYVDRFGNLISNVSARDLDAFPSASLSVSIGSVSAIPLVSAYAQVQRGEPLAILNSWGMLELAVREGSAALMLGAVRGTPLVIETHRP